jgi:enoyl-CoA hydratase/carnithine racemase
VPETALTLDERVAHLVLDRPGRRNAITPAMLEGIVAACAAIEVSDVDVVVLGASGPDFSVGLDLALFEDESAIEAAQLGGEAVEALRDLGAVTIAELRGWVVGGGVALAGACDLRVAEAGTRFRIPEVPLGIPLGWGAVPLLVATVGPAVTKDLVMTGRDMGLDEAIARGFVSRVGPAGSLVERLLEIAPGPLRETKRQVDEATAIRRTGASDAERLRAAIDDPDFLEAFRRYRTGIGS